MKSVKLPPDASVLLESMRAIGYEPATAVADLVDNSITAGAGHVSVRFDPGLPRSLAILDDGAGMNEAELLRAMRHGSRSPNDVRAENDLGRFGLGLKTASLSQCRRLTVVSKKNGIEHGMVWDLDDVTVDWVAGLLEAADLKAVPFIDELEPMPHGTLIVWEKLDRLAAGDPGDGSVMSERMQQVADHLSLVFHRYLSDRPAKLTIDVNLQPVVPLNPFLEGDGATIGEEERITVDGHPIVLRSYTLPHISRLTRSQIEKAGGEIGLRRQQGFYVYRNRRLIVWGTWFRMFRQEELTKLTRVRVDVPNALDHLWSLDIKKSAARPPEVIRDRLKGLVPTMVKLSRQANEYRGRIISLKEVRSIWCRMEDRDGVRYEVDRTHPLIAALRVTAGDSLLPDIDNVLKAVADSLPVEALYNDRANDKIGHKSEYPDDGATSERLEELARQMLGAFADRREDRERLLAGLGTIEPFAMYPALVKRIQARLLTP